jgi:hypothetical protein
MFITIINFIKELIYELFYWGFFSCLASIIPALLLMFKRWFHSKGKFWIPYNHPIDFLIFAFGMSMSIIGITRKEIKIGSVNSDLLSIIGGIATFCALLSLFSYTESMSYVKSNVKGEVEGKIVEVKLNDQYRKRIFFVIKLTSTFNFICWLILQIFILINK